MLLRLLLTSICLLCFSVQAVEIQNLYQSSVQVKDKSRQARIEAGQDALTCVIKKLTGVDNTQSHKLVRQALRDYSEYLTKYEYVENSEGELKASFLFDETKMNQLVRDANWPFWGNRRPQIVLWMVIEDNQTREFVTRESYPQLERLIYDKATEWGLPILVPLLNLQDRLQVGVPEVWANFSEPVENASKRYGAERVITARIFQQPASSSWMLEWRYTDALYFEPQQLVGDKQVIISQMVENLAHSLLEEFSISNSSIAELKTDTITIRNLRNFKEIELAKRRLQSISSIKDVDIFSRSEGTVEFVVQHVSNVVDLKKALSLEQALSIYVDPNAFYHVENDKNLTYEWVGK